MIAVQLTRRKRRRNYSLSHMDGYDSQNLATGKSVGVRCWWRLRRERKSSRGQGEKAETKISGRPCSKQDLDWSLDVSLARLADGRGVLHLAGMGRRSNFIQIQPSCAGRCGRVIRRCETVLASDDKRRGCMTEMCQKCGNDEVGISRWAGMLVC